MSSDYERNEWRESVEGLKSKCKSGFIFLHASFQYMIAFGN